MNKTIVLKKPYNVDDLNNVVSEMYEAYNYIVHKLVETDEYTFVYFTEMEQNVLGVHMLRGLIGYLLGFICCFLIIGTYATHVLRLGDTLYQIARKTYGHKDYAKYIILYNNLTPPYNLPLGTELLLPQLVEKEEFADTPKIQ